MQVRIPAGVRIDGMGVGGRYVSIDMLPVLADATDDTGRVLLLDLAARELDRATAAHEKLERQFLDDPKRYAGRRAEAEDVRVFWESVVDDTTDQLVGKPTRKRTKKAKRPMTQTAGASADVDETMAPEWELGVEYLSASGPGSNVDINVRVRRTDGRPMGFNEAANVLSSFRANLARGADNPVPSGYKFAGINWRSPNKGSRRWKSGGKRDLETFSTLLSESAAKPQAWRLGAVE